MIDFATIVGSTDAYNFHSHTQFCDGRAEMSQFAEAAVEAGFKHYGFSPHSPVPVDSPCNMSREDVSVYFDEFNRLKAKYAGKIHLYAGMEIDYFGTEWGPANGYFNTLPLDYSIGSVHFIPSDKGMIDVDGRFESFRKKMDTYFANDIRHVVKLFYSQTQDMIQAGGFDILGHFDKIGHNAAHFRPGIGDEKWYRDIIDDTIDLIIDKKPVVEINTKARQEHNRFFPHERSWSRLVKGGVTLMVNSDAHFTDLIDASRGEAIALLETIEK